MKKVLLFILSVMTGFIFVILFIECVKLFIQGIKWLIKKIRTWRIDLANSTRAMKSKHEMKKAERKAAREEKKNQKVDLEVNVSETTGA